MRSWDHISVYHDKGNIIGGIVRAVIYLDDTMKFLMISLKNSRQINIHDLITTKEVLKRSKWGLNGHKFEDLLFRRNKKRKKQMEINKILYFISYADSIEGINGANI